MPSLGLPPSTVLPPRLQCLPAGSDHDRPLSGKVARMWGDHSYFHDGSRIIWWALLVLTALAVLLSGGCVPVGHLDAAPVAGQVVDRATRRPVVGATVVLSTLYRDHEARAQTDADGRFHFPGFRHVDFIVLPYAMFRAPTGHLHVEAAGYRAYDRSEFFDTEDGPGYSRYNASGNLVQVRIELARVGRR